MSHVMLGGIMRCKKIENASLSPFRRSRKAYSKQQDNAYPEHLVMPTVELHRH